MLRSYSLNNPVNSRAMDDFIAQERRARERAERDLAACLELLTDLAAKLDGENFQKMRRNNPAIPKTWTLSEWRAYLLNAAHQTAFRAIRWGEPPSLVPDGRDEQIAKLKEQLADLKARLVIAERALKPPEDEAQKQPRRYPFREGHKAAPVAAETMVKSVTPDTHIIDSYLEVLERFRAWSINIPPATAAYADYASDNSPWHKYFSFICAIGKHGLSGKMEVAQLAGEALGVSPSNGSFRILFDKLIKAGYIHSETWSAAGSHIAYVRLTDAGRVMYKTVSGADPVETEWERLIRLHRGELDKSHAAACSLFAIQARWRGWKTAMLPHIENGNSRARPDLVIEKDGQRLSVEVEMSIKDKIIKWRNLSDLNGGLVALCAGTGARRDRLAGDCRLAKIPGVATDIEYFRSPKYGEGLHTAPLWVEQWT
jgi:hypothetical protein